MSRQNSTYIGRIRRAGHGIWVDPHDLTSMECKVFGMLYQAAFEKYMEDDYSSASAHLVAAHFIAITLK